MKYVVEMVVCLPILLQYSELFICFIFYHKPILIFQVNKMNLEEREDCFILESTDPNKPNVGFVCQVPIDMLDQWVTTIKNILQTQKDFLKAIQSPIAYQKELTKEL